MTVNISPDFFCIVQARAEVAPLRSWTEEELEALRRVQNETRARELSVEGVPVALRVESIRL